VDAADDAIARTQGDEEGVGDVDGVVDDVGEGVLEAHGVEAVKRGGDFLDDVDGKVVDGGGERGERFDGQVVGGGTEAGAGEFEDHRQEEDQGVARLITVFAQGDF
jgi:hypothetical protein